ncbi:MAG: hypothetical protein R3C26_05805 [Calditrichia bacterium]
MNCKICPENVCAKSTIIIPLRIQRNLYGFGVIYSQQEDAITIEQLSSVNVILGLLSLMIFQHYYFFSTSNSGFCRRRDCTRF